MTANPQPRRLRTREQFQAILACAPLARTEHFVMHSLTLPVGEAQPAPNPLFAGADAWIGAMVPKRWARRAVTRNLIKRQVYSLTGVAGRMPAAAACVIRLRSAFDPRSFPSAASDALRAAVRAELTRLLQRATRPTAEAAK